MLSPDRRRGLLLAGGLAAVVGALTLGLPYGLETAVARWGVRGSAAALLLPSLLSLALARSRWRAALGAGAWPGVALVALLAAALVGGASEPLRLAPAVVYATAAGIFHASLSGPESLIERAVRFAVPEAPDFVRPYCRRLTALWVAFFALTAVVIAALALLAPVAWWRAWTGWIVYASMLALGAIEFVVRKTWFRYYFHGGPFDRLWSRLFPAESTARGRRSLEAIRRAREARTPGASAARAPGGSGPGPG